MTQLARDRYVGSGQRELCGGVIERGPLPLDGGVTQAAILGKSRSDVIRIRGLVIVGRVARGTSHGGPRILACGVALLAGDRHMGSGQGKFGGAVVENRSLPLGGGVTCGAILAEAGRAVVRVGSLVEIRQMARGTGG